MNPDIELVQIAREVREKTEQWLEKMRNLRRTSYEESTNILFLSITRTNHAADAIVYFLDERD